MQIDKTTYNDLSIFSQEEEFSIFHKIDFTRTVGGRELLRWMMTQPASDLKQIRETQQIQKVIINNIDAWTLNISNGTMMVMERFYDATIDTIPSNPNLLNSLTYKWFHGPDYGLVRYSVKHFRDFVSGMCMLGELIEEIPSPPQKLQLFASRITSIMKDPILRLMVQNKSEQLQRKDVLYYGNYFKYKFKNRYTELADIFYQTDAWYSMAMAAKKYNLEFPEFLEAEEPFINAEKIYHILLTHPTSYDIQLSPSTNFIFLTGANMAGKSTFIKSLGVAVYLAHLGMGVPAKKMQLTLFDGVLSNINVVDNIVKGESYFFNEVQRIKNTILTINDGRKWLVLIDELFKGTNVQDAMRCSLAVINGLIKIKGSLFVLSTHLYEIGEEIQNKPNIAFKYFETSVNNDKLEFSYQLKDGISNDRLGYFILKTEKVVELLESL